MQKLPDFYPFDFFAEYQQVQGFIEYKRRSHNFGAYPTVYIPAHKWVACRQWCRELKAPGKFFVQWDDAIKSCDILEDMFTLSISGRFDRLESDSKQPMVEIPVSRFA